MISGIITELEVAFRWDFLGCRILIPRIGDFFILGAIKKSLGMDYPGDLGSKTNPQLISCKNFMKQEAIFGGYFEDKKSLIRDKLSPYPYFILFKDIMYSYDHLVVTWTLYLYILCPLIISTLIISTFLIIGTPFLPKRKCAYLEKRRISEK